MNSTLACIAAMAAVPAFAQDPSIDPEAVVRAALKEQADLLARPPALPSTQVEHGQRRSPRDGAAQEVARLQGHHASVMVASVGETYVR